MSTNLTEEEKKNITRALLSDPPNRATLAQELIDPLLRPVLQGPFDDENDFLETWLQQAAKLKNRFSLKVSAPLMNYLPELGVGVDGMEPSLDFRVVKAHKRVHKVAGASYGKELADIVYVVVGNVFGQGVCLSRYVQVKRVTGLKANMDLAQYYLYRCDPGFDIQGTTVHFGDYYSHHHYHYWFIDGDVDSSNCLRRLCSDGLSKETFGPTLRGQKTSPQGIATRRLFWSIMDSLDDLRRTPLLHIDGIEGELQNQQRIPLEFCNKGPPRKSRKAILDFAKTHNRRLSVPFESPQQHLIDSLLLNHGIDCDLANVLYSKDTPNPAFTELWNHDGSPREHFSEWDNERDAAILWFGISLKEKEGRDQKPLQRKIFR